ncbi:hypothetical protein SAMN05421869_110226 [Nonomuraea jiangxiensis]|uniref:Uncharacterized protein n=1 Tax=Nonomuraea jiangxiensis TaxID=633440 RepID=A0A1G8TM22_9ACTN|nr:hypothetical protein SAMN05421869_110226 [Nonomuraea jiangxiensis]
MTEDFSSIDIQINARRLPINLRGTDIERPRGTTQGTGHTTPPQRGPDPAHAADRTAAPARTVAAKPLWERHPARQAGAGLR